MPTIDPSRTKILRARYIADFTRRWKLVRQGTKTVITEREFVGLTPEQQARSVARYVDALIGRAVFDDGVWQSQYIRGAYVRGLGNAVEDLRRGGYRDIGNPGDIVAQTAHAAAIATLLARYNADLRKIQASTVQQVIDKMTLALVAGLPLPDVADEVDKRIRGVGLVRSGALAQTAAVATVAAATLALYERFGVPLVEPSIEQVFTTAGDSRVCPVCLELSTRDNGRGPGIYTIDQARGVIPVHVKCRCSWQSRISKVGRFEGTRQRVTGVII